MKTYHTKEEVLSYYHTTQQEEIVTLGFNCINSFCETSRGWVESFEDCCPYCVHTIVKRYGSKPDKVKFNNIQDLGDKYIIPLTRKDIALDNKRIKKNKNTRYKSGVARKDLEAILSMFRRYKINVQRVGSIICTLT